MFLSFETPLVAVASHRPGLVGPSVPRYACGEFPHCDDVQSQLWDVPDERQRVHAQVHRVGHDGCPVLVMDDSPARCGAGAGDHVARRTDRDIIGTLPPAVLCSRRHAAHTTTRLRNCLAQLTASFEAPLARQGTR
eukprot:CAMPEP_0197591190 /NCGR_PEP_ID=MMETSP1326-20131121/12931_1 /TAXON_ID=1155430 /ORGANISM="Genus nov. species nov., Strain RCC2288" /LENGTH=135 /DNA_ID=CAMNT_0043156571 /DNA_START=848 /DNA_END=1251 /DNA_ORIENTATION=-